MEELFQYLAPSELQAAVAEAYPSALQHTALEAFEGRFEADEIEPWVDQVALLRAALAQMAAFQFSSQFGAKSEEQNR